MVSKLKSCTAASGCRCLGSTMRKFRMRVSELTTTGSRSSVPIAPHRLFGIALIGLDDIKEGVKELERSRENRP